MQLTSYEFTPYSAVMAVITVIELIIVYFAWRRRATAGARCLMWLFAAMAESSFSYILLYASTTPETTTFWYQMAYFGFAVAGPLYLLFGLEYTKMNQLIGRRFTMLLAILPVVTIILVWTNPLHHLVFLNLTQPAVAPTFQPERGIWSLALRVYTYLCIGSAIYLLIRTMQHYPPFFRSQVLIIISAAIPPVIGSGWELVNNPLPGFEWSLLGYGISGILIAYAIWRQHMFNLVPFAREQLIDSMADGVVVLDTEDNVLDINASAHLLLKSVGGTLIGQSARKVFPVWQEIEHGQGGVITIPDDTAGNRMSMANRHVDIHVTPLLDQFKSVIGRMFILRDVTLIQQQMAEIQILQDRLRAEAIHDELTGLYNQHYLGEALAQGLAQARRDHLPFSLVMLDIDRFTDVNQTHGRDAGDLVLCQVANLLLRSTRGGDVICRYKDDKFTLLLPNTSLEDAFSCAERWRTSAENMGIVLNGSRIPFTISLGVAGYPNFDGSLDELLAIADQALNTAKNSGRNRTVLWRQALASSLDAPEMRTT